MRALQDASTIRSNPKVLTFYQKIRSDNEAASAVGSGCGAAGASDTLQTASSGILDGLKDRWSSLMATVQTNIEGTIQDVALLLPFKQPSLAPGSGEHVPLSQRDINVQIAQSPLKKQRAEKDAGSDTGTLSQQAAQSTLHSSIGVTGEKLVWSGAGSLSSACNCLMVLKQVGALPHLTPDALRCDLSSRAKTLRLLDGKTVPTHAVHSPSAARVFDAGTV
jgi:hypothetical protein